MPTKSLVAAGFAAALMVLGTAPASANANISTDTAAAGTVARIDAAAPSSYCGCGRRYYVRYYVPVRYVYTYRVRYVRYYY